MTWSLATSLGLKAQQTRSGCFAPSQQERCEDEAQCRQCTTQLEERHTLWPATRSRGGENENWGPTQVASDGKQDPVATWGTDRVVELGFFNLCW